MGEGGKKSKAFPIKTSAGNRAGVRDIILISVVFVSQAETHKMRGCAKHVAGVVRSGDRKNE